MRARSLRDLKFYAEQYPTLILKQIIRIQKWFRACR